MDYFIVIAIIVLQIGTWSLGYSSVKYGFLQPSSNKNLAFAGGYGTVFVMGVIVYLLFRRSYRHVDPLIYVFALLSFANLTKLGLALELDGLIPKALSSLAVEYKPCLKSAHGVAYLYWDGSVNTFLALLCIAIYTCRKSHREVALFWIGSMLNGAAVMLSICLTGNDEIKWPTVIDCNILLILILVLVNMLHNRPAQARTFLKFPPIWKRYGDLLFFILFMILSVIVGFRSLAMEGANFMKDYVKSVEPNLAASRFQVLTYDYVYGIYFLFVLYSLWCPGQHWMADFALVVAGGAAQGQFNYVAASMSSRTLKSLRPPMEGNTAVIFWTVQALLFLVPQLFVWWTQRDTEHFGYTHTQDLASPIRKRTYHIRQTRETVTTVTRSDKADKDD